jgi:hypothetical protein
MNIADVTIAGVSIGLSVRLKATAVVIADGQRPTVASASRRVQWDGAGGAYHFISTTYAPDNGAWEAKRVTCAC